MPPERRTLPPPPGTRSVEDIAFGPHARQAIDLHLPASGEIKGVVANIHGGSWQWLDRKVMAFWNVLDHGWAVVGMGYRMSDHAPFPAQICDINAGLAKLAQIAPDYGLPMDRVAIMGLSAGGHLAALAGLARDQPGFGPSHGIDIKGVIDIYGPSDLISLDWQWKRDPTRPPSAVTKLLGASVTADPHHAYRASPVAHVTDRPVMPFLFVHGDEDAVVPLSHSLVLHAQLTANGTESQLKVIPGGGHATPDMHAPPVQTLIADFLKKVLQPNA